MKVLILVHGLPVGGTERMVADLCRWLRGHGVEPHVACLDLLGELGEDLEAEGVPCTVLGPRRAFDRTLGPRIAALVRAEGIGLIHGHQYAPYFYGVLAKRRCRVPLIFTEHGRFFPDRPRFRRRLFNRTVGRSVDRITAVSEAVREALVRVEGFPRDRIEVLYNGIDPAPLAGLKRDADYFDRNWGIPAEAPVVGTIGRLNPIKDHESLVAAFRQVRQAVPRAHLVIVGDGECREPLERQVAELGVAEAVHLVGQHEDVRPWLGRMDVFALSSVSEGMPMTLLEAMAAGVPIVSTDVGGIHEMLATDREALLVPKENPEALAGALARVLGEVDLGQALAAAARERLGRRFTLDVIGARYLALYRELYRPAGGVEGGR